MFRIAKPESFVLISPSRSEASGIKIYEEVITKTNLLGGQAEWSRMYASHHGAHIRVLH